MKILDPRYRRTLIAGAALATAGLGSGAVIGATMTAGASTTSSSSGATSVTAPATSPSTSTAPTGTPDGGPAGDHHGPDLSTTGTVTAVGTDSVTIDGKVYAVTSSSDIDKNGEAALSDLKAGDAVRFSTVSGASTPTIDKLHAGTESLDRPTGPPPGAQAPSGSSSSSGSSTAG